MGTRQPGFPPGQEQLLVKDCQGMSAPRALPSAPGALGAGCGKAHPRAGAQDRSTNGDRRAAEQGTESLFVVERKTSPEKLGGEHGRQQEKGTLWSLGTLTSDRQP